MANLRGQLTFWITLVFLLVAAASPAETGESRFKPLGPASEPTYGERIVLPPYRLEFNTPSPDIRIVNGELVFYDEAIDGNYELLQRQQLVSAVTQVLAGTQPMGPVSVASAAVLRPTVSFNGYSTSVEALLGDIKLARQTIPIEQINVIAITNHGRADGKACIGPDAVDWSKELYAVLLELADINAERARENLPPVQIIYTACFGAMAAQYIADETGSPVTAANVKTYADYGAIDLSLHAERCGTVTVFQPRP